MCVPSIKKCKVEGEGKGIRGIWWVTPRMSCINMNPMLPGRLWFGSLEMSAYQSLCLKIPHYHEQNGSQAKKTKTEVLSRHLCSSWKKVVLCLGMVAKYMPGIFCNASHNAGKLSWNYWIWIIFLSTFKFYLLHPYGYDNFPICICFDLSFNYYFFFIVEDRHLSLQSHHYT